MIDPNTALSLVDLCDAVDVTPRTVRYYIQQGLLPPADGAGQSASYNSGHLARLQLIKRLQATHLPLAEIRAKLDALPPGGEHQLLAQPPPPPTSAAEYIRAALAGTPSPAAPAPRRPGPPLQPPDVTASPGFGARSTWDHHVLHRDIELHVRRPLDPAANRKLERLLELARTLFKEPS